MEKFGRETEQKMVGKPILTERERENRSVDLSEMIDLVNSTEPSLDSDSLLPEASTCSPAHTPQVADLQAAGSLACWVITDETRWNDQRWDIYYLPWWLIISHGSFDDFWSCKFWNPIWELLALSQFTRSANLNDTSHGTPDAHHPTWNKHSNRKLAPFKDDLTIKKSHVHFHGCFSRHVVGDFPITPPFKRLFRSGQEHWSSPGGIAEGSLCRTGDQNEMGLASWSLMPLSALTPGCINCIHLIGRLAKNMLHVFIICMYMYAVCMSMSMYIYFIYIYT